jgi:hypothetical protein
VQLPPRGWLRSTACAWLPDGTGIVTGGVKGLYVFDFHPGTPG